MFKNLNPARAEQTNEKMDRRSALASFGAFAAAPIAAGLTGAASAAPAQSARESLNLNFSDAEDNLTAWVKLVSSLEDGKETCGYFSGT